MSESVLIPILFVIAIPAYWLITLNSAINSRALYIDEVDEYLGNEENPEELKLMVFHFFDQSLSHFLPSSALLYFLFFSNGKNSKHSLKKLKEKFGGEKLKKALRLAFKLLSVNVRLSPIQYGNYALLLIVVSLVRILFTLPSIVFENTINKTENAWYRAIH